MKKIIYLCLACFITACEGFLDEKPSKSIVVPTTLEDFQALLDNSVHAFAFNPSLGVIATDDFEINDDSFSSFSLDAQEIFKWEQDVFQDNFSPSDWTRPYQQIYYVNVVLQESASFVPSNIDEARRIAELRAQAKFLRANALFDLINLFGPSLALKNEIDDKFIPVLLKPEIKFELPFFSLQEIFNQIENDLLESIEGLPEIVTYLSRPQKSAGYALLARLYFAVEDYEKVLDYTNKTIEIKNTLLDFNTLDISLVNPFQIYMQEVLFFSYAWVHSGNINNPNLKVSNSLLAEYAENDLRKDVFFNPNPNGDLIMTGHYSGDNRFFGGIALNEVYFMAIESNIRLGQIDEAINLLNIILEKRFAGTLVLDLEQMSKNQLLNFVIGERRKELVGHSFIRLFDMKRLSRDPLIQFEATRIIEGQNFTFPGAGFYVLIPQFERLTFAGEALALVLGDKR